MKVIYGIGRLKSPFKNSVLAIGVFDGLHIGHQELIKKTIERAKAIGGTSIVLTFSPHPVHVLHPEIHLPLIVSLPYRLKLIEELGVDISLVIRFTKQFSKLSSEKFIKEYLVKFLAAKEVFVGDDFRFGQNRSGTLDYFKEAAKIYGFKVHGVHPVGGSQHKISSTDIRNLISEGKLDEAKQFLGRPVSIMGVVKKGEQRGRILGFPTANIEWHDEILPPLGVYAVGVEIDKKVFRGMANLGRRPTFKAAKSPVNIEVHIFDFNKNIYGK